MSASLPAGCAAFLEEHERATIERAAIVIACFGALGGTHHAETAQVARVHL